MKGLARAQLEAVFERAWNETRSPGDVAEAIQRAVLAHVENDDDRIIRIGPTAQRRPPKWSPDDDPRVSDIIAAVSAYRMVPICEIVSSSQKRLPARARHEAAWIIRTTLRYSYGIIGSALGRQDHSTVMGGCRKIQRLVDADPSYGHRLHDIMRGLGLHEREAA